MGWNKQWRWTSRSDPGSLLLTCHVSSCLARGSWTLTRLWALLLQLLSRLVDVWVAGHTFVSTPACTAAATEGSADTLLNISAHERFYESQLGLAPSSSFSVFCPLLCCQNPSKYERICEKGIADMRLPKQLLLIWEVCCLAWLMCLEMILSEYVEYKPHAKMMEKHCKSVIFCHELFMDVTQVTYRKHT